MSRYPAILAAIAEAGQILIVMAKPGAIRLTVTSFAGENQITTGRKTKAALWFRYHEPHPKLRSFSKRGNDCRERQQ